MDPSDWQRAKEIFLAVVDLPSGERADELERRCGDDRALLARVRDLLDRDDESSEANGTSPRAWSLGSSSTFRAREKDTPEPFPGLRVGRYMVLEEIGRGGMGVVCAAWDPTLDRKVALKLVRTVGPRSSREIDESDVRLLREARALARLSHPNVVAVYDSGIWRDRIFVAMDFIEGRDLLRWAEKESPSLRQRLEAMRAAGLGLAAAHEAGLLHRDFKPHNVMIGPGDRVRVVDFGLVRPIDGGDAELPDETTESPLAAAEGSSSSPPMDPGAPLTRAGSLLGTPGFIAPEAIAGRPLDARSDQYAFCAALYELIYDRPPTGDARGIDRLRRTHRGDLEPPVTSAPSGRVPVWLREILERGLSRDPERRFADMRELLDALEQGLRPSLRALRSAAVAVVALGVLAAWGWWRGGSGDARCRGDLRIATVWNGEREAALVRAFRDVSTPWAAATGEAVASLIDERATRWAEEYREACEATRVRGEQSEELLDLRMACLEERRREIEVLVDTVAAGLSSSPGAPSSTLEAAGSLSSLADCRDTVSLRTTVELPDDPPTRLKLAEVRDRLAEARVARWMKDLESGAASLEAAAQGAREIGWDPLDAEVADEAGLLADAASRTDEAREHFFAAFRAALAGRSDREAIRALSGLAWIDGYRRESVERGLDWQRLARSRLEHVADAGDLERRLGLVDGAIAFAAGDLEKAEESWSRELAASREALGADHPRTLDLELRLAGVLHGLGRAEEALGLIEDHVERVEKKLGAAHPMLGVALAQRGNVLFGLGRAAEAEADFRRAVDLLVGAYGTSHSLTLTAMNNLAWVLFRTGRESEGVALQEEVAALQEELWDGAHPDVAVAYGNLVEMHLALGRGEQAIGMAERALEVTRAASPADPEQLLVATSNLGWVLLETGRPRHAIAPLEEALYLAEGRLEPARTARVRFLLARALRASGADPVRSRQLAEVARRDAREGGLEALVERIGQWMDEAGEADR